MEFFTEDKKDPINLILLQWYDEIDEEMYGCSRIWLTDQYTFVYLDSVDMSIHIIPRNNVKMNILLISIFFKYIHFDN